VRALLFEGLISHVILP